MTPYVSPAAPGDPARRPMTLPRLRELKAEGQPIVMITAYDYPSARVAEEAGVDVVLVGDSGAMTMLGYPSTVGIDIEEMLMMARAVRRGLATPLLVADLPFGSFEASDEQAVRTAMRFIKEAGCDAVKLEGGGPTPLARVRAVVAAGIPVMGHVGLTPQTAANVGGFKAQGRTAEAATRIGREAADLEEAGCFALIFEAIPAAVADRLMSRVTIPVIGIGAGPGTDGQVLVFHDLLGIGDGSRARFVKRYADLHQAMLGGVQDYAADVRTRGYPASEHTYGIDDTELERLDGLLRD